MADDTKDKRYRLRHPARVKAASDRHYIANRDSILAKRRAKYQRDRDEILARLKLDRVTCPHCKHTLTRPYFAKHVCKGLDATECHSPMPSTLAAGS